MDKTQQGFGDSYTKIDSDTEHGVTPPKTPDIVEEISVAKSLETSVPEPKSPKVRKTYSRLKNVEAVKWQPKTRPSNKFHLNINKILNPEFKNEGMIEIEESTSEEDVQSKRFEGMISQALESIEGNIKLILYLPVGKFVDKVKKVISELDEGTSKEHSGVEEDMKYMHAKVLKHYVEGQRILSGENLVEEQINKNLDILNENLQAKEETELMNLKKALHHYKAQNSHLNQLNDQLVLANRMIRTNIEEISSNYVELVQVAEEAVKRRKMAQERNEELIKHNQEHQEKVPAMEKELNRLRRRSQALDGLTMLAKATCNI